MEESVWKESHRSVWIGLRKITISDRFIILRNENRTRDLTNMNACWNYSTEKFDAFGRNPVWISADIPLILNRVCDFFFVILSSFLIQFRITNAVIKGTNLEFAWKEWLKPRKTFARTTGACCEICCLEILTLWSELVWFFYKTSERNLSCHLLDS